VELFDIAKRSKDRKMNSAAIPVRRTDADAIRLA
jgi:hypothetical protein